MANLVTSFSPDFSLQTMVLPRGITNPNNWCYLLAPLQSLFHIPAFSNLMLLLATDRPLATTLSRFPAPALKAMVATASRYRACRPGSKLLGGPSDIIAMLQRQNTFPVVAGRQEDSEEFLSFLLNSMHEEFGIVFSSSCQLHSPIQVKTSRCFSYAFSVFFS